MSTGALTMDFYLPRTPAASLAESDLAILLPSKTDPRRER